MLIGQREAGPGAIFYLRGFRVNKKGFTLIEILVVTLIMGVLCSGLFLTLTVGEFSSSVSQAKVDLQAKVRLIMDAITRDVRQSKPEFIDPNNPGANHIKFKLVAGTNETSGNPDFGNNPYIEYTYNDASDELTRSIVNDAGAILQSRTFYNITNTTFFSAENETLASGTVITSKRLIIHVEAESRAREARNLLLNYSLTEEVKIRNE